MSPLDEMNVIHIRTAHGYKVVCLADIRSVSTYVLLEQERWFEKEVDFFARYIKPGMTIIDIGANVGVYSLLSAQKTGPDGRVIAYEPNPKIAQLLAQGAKVNGLNNLTICETAVSDKAGETFLSRGEGSELGAIGASDEGYPVKVVSLDGEMAARGWERIDVMKIDAEGVETKILEGAAAFLKNLSPLIMIEINHADGREFSAAKMIEEAGYKLFRQLGVEPLLIPLKWEEVDTYELNVFAVPPRLVEPLQSERLLTRTIPAWKSSASDETKARAWWRERKHLRHLPPKAFVLKDGRYAEALAAYVGWADEKRPVANRVSALFHALTMLRALCADKPSLARLISLARVLTEAGCRTDAIHATNACLNQIPSAGPLALDEIFIAPSYNAELTSPRDDPAEWLRTFLMEQAVTLSNHSTVYDIRKDKAAEFCAAIESKSFASQRTRRTRVLTQSYSGQDPWIPEALSVTSEKNLNPQHWTQEALLKLTPAAG